MDCSFQLIDQDGQFNVNGLDAFSKTVKLGECGLSYAVVSIIGSQSSGKSTLLNHLFGTKFLEMDTKRGRCETTKGILVAKCVDIEPCTLAIDLEGSDGVERGQDDIVFEKRSALFALAISDVVLINMWCHDIGRENAGSRPLLRTAFEMMLRLVSLSRTTLLFVIRDKTRTPPERLEKDLRINIEQIYDSVAKPHNRKETPLNEIFNVEVIFLSSYEYMEVEFKEQVANMRLRFINSIAPGGLAGDQRGKLPASEFSSSAQTIWENIMENKDLNLPAYKVMVANVRCEEIANEQFAHFAGNKDWSRLEKAVQLGPVLDFGKKLSSIINTCLSEYDAEALYFDKSVATSKRKFLQDRVLQLIQPAYLSMLEHLHSRALDEFKEAFTDALNRGKQFAVAAGDCSEKFLSVFYKGCEDADIEQANWDSSNINDKLLRDIDAYVSSVRATKLSDLRSCCEGKLTMTLSKHVEALLNEARHDTWLDIRKHLRLQTDSAIFSFSKDISGFDIDQKTMDEMSANIENYARSVVQAKARESAGRVMIQMRDRFSTLFSSSLPTTWTGTEDIPAVAETAYSASLRLLSVMAADRLDDDADNIANTLSGALLGSTDTSTNDESTPFDPLTLSTWKEVPSIKTFITPVQCKSMWRVFKAEMECLVVCRAIEAWRTVIRANDADDAAAKANNAADQASATLAELKRTVCNIIDVVDGAMRGVELGMHLSGSKLSLLSELRLSLSELGSRPNLDPTVRTMVDVVDGAVRGVEMGLQLSKPNLSLSDLRLSLSELRSRLHAEEEKQ